MIKLLPGSEAFLNWLLNNSIQAGALVLLVLLVQKIFRRQLTSRWRFALWWVVLIRLILPFGPESALSIFNLWHPSINVAAIPSAMKNQSDDSDFRSKNSLSYELYFAQRNHVQHEVIISGEESPELARAVAIGNSIANPGHPTHLKMRHPANRVAFGFAILWVSGAIALGICVLFQLIRFNRKLRQSASEPDENLSQFLTQCQHQFGITRHIKLLETDAVKSPALFGLFRLKLLLPKGLADQFTPGELRYIFLHELAHVKRCDLWLNWLVTLLQIVHWFNPLIWLGFARLRADRELACDELALLRAGEKVGTAYGETVIKLLEGASRPAAIPGLVGILEDKKQMRRRIQMIANFRRPGRWSALAVLLLIALAAAALTNAQTKKDDSEQSNPQQIEDRLTSEASFTQTGSQIGTATVLNNSAPMNSPISHKQQRSLRLRVLHSVLHEPISGVRVQASYGSDQLTDSKGFATLAVPPLEAGFYWMITISRDGFVPKYISWSAFQNDTVEDIPAEYTARMDRAETIGGLIVDEHGNGIAGVKLIFSGPTSTGIPDRERSTIMGDYHSEITDQSGRWSCRHVPDDFSNISFRLVHSNYITATFRCDNASEWPSGALRVSNKELSAGQAKMTLQKGLEISGRVRDENGFPVRGARVTKNREWREPFSTVETDADGRFQFSNAETGPLMLTVQTRDLAPETTNLVVGEATREISFVLRPGKTLRGKVVDENDRSVAGAVIEVDRVNFRPAELDWKIRTDADGRFLWIGAPLRALPYVISAPGFIPRWIPFLVANGEDQIFHLQRRANGEATNELKGTVVLPDGKPAANAQVAIRVGGVPITIDHSESPPTFNTYGSGFLARTDENGEFILPYRERAIELVVSHEAGFARTELNTAAPGFHITLQPWGEIQGTLRVNNHSGSNEWVGLQTLSLKSGLVLRNYQDQTYASGAFSIDHVPPGEYRLSRLVQQGEHSTTVHPLGSFTLKPGLITRVAVGGNGIPIFGKLIFSEPSEAGTNLDLSAWLESSSTPARRFPAVVSANGHFSASDIPAGEYFLNLRATVPMDELPMPKNIKAWPFTSAPKKVVVPDSSPENAAAGVDMGEIQLEPLKRSSDTGMKTPDL